ncbi:MAG: SpoIID/LytB domain-containing protein [bacterium]
MRWAFLITIFSILLVVSVHSAYADEFDAITKQLEDTKRDLDSSVSATRTNEAQLREMTQRINQIRTAVTQLEAAVADKERTIQSGDQKLAISHKQLEEAITSHYKQVVSQRGFTIIDLFSPSFAEVSLVHKKNKELVEGRQKSMILLAMRIKNTEEDQRRLEEHQVKLDSFKSELARQSAFLAGEIIGAKSYQDTLSKKIAELSSRQKSIIDARSAQFTASANNDDLSDDANASSAYDPGFRPAFAFFSIGAYTHRLGMSQYGAKARADAGQNYRDILKAYFPSGTIEEKGEISGNITVTNIGSMNFETQYLYGLAEMPSSWNKEALKAQAILARTYALRYTDNLGREICAAESCQVHSPSKAANVPDAWRQAVDETKGVVLKDGGEYAKAFYSSTTGGYLTSSGWDTTDGQGTDFLNTAWEKKARSPWFYKAWYRVAYSNSSDSCGRTHPWLSEWEMADILNAWNVRKNGSSEEVDRIVPVTINRCSIGGSGGNPFSMDELAGISDKYGGRYSQVSSASQSYSKEGFTSEIRFSTNRGDVTIPGGEFKQIFNLRAPGHISIRNTLYAVEKR